jgi:HEAT repeat protein
MLSVLLLSAAGCSSPDDTPVLAGGHEVESWVEALKDSNPQVRRQAVLKLGNVGDDDPAAEEALTGALRDTDALVRRDAVYAVVKLAKPGEAIIAELESMSRNDADPAVRDVAARALARIARDR